MKFTIYDLRFTIVRLALLLLTFHASRFNASAVNTNTVRVEFPLLSMFGGNNYTKSFRVEAVNPVLTDGTNVWVGTYTTVTPAGGTNPIVAVTPNDYLVTFTDARTPWKLHIPNTTNLLSAVTQTAGPMPTFLLTLGTNASSGSFDTNSPVVMKGGVTLETNGSVTVPDSVTAAAVNSSGDIFALRYYASGFGFFGSGANLTNGLGPLISAAEAASTVGANATNFIRAAVANVWTNGTPGNGAGLTNLAGFTPTNSGAVLTNVGTLLNLPGIRAYRPPLNFFNTWASATYGGGPWVASTNLTGYTNILVTMTNLVNAGYARLGYGFQIDEVRGAIGYDALGNCYWPSNQFPQGMKAVADICHALGMPFGLCVPLGTNAAVPLTGGGLRPENLEQSATNIASWGVDFVYIISDNGGFGEGLSTFEMYKRFITAYRGQGKGVRVMAGLDGSGGNQLRPWMLEQLGDGLLFPWPNYADSPSTPTAIWSALDNLATVFGGVGGQNIYPYISFMGGANGDTAAIDFNMWNTRTAVNALYHGVMGVPAYYGDTEGSYAGKVNHTNEWMLSVQQDIGCWPPTQVATNNGIQVLATRLGDWNSNRRAVVFANRITNATQTASITWSNLSLPDGTYIVRDVWNMSQFTSTTNALGVSLTKYKCGFYIIEPAVVATIPSMYVTNTQTGVTLSGALNQNPIGSGNVNYGTNGFVGGQTSTVGPLATNGFSFGTTMNVTGNRAVGLGGGLSGGIVSGADAIGMGNAPTASGSQSMAFGNGTASGTGDYVFGPQSLASGNYGFALGYKARKTAQGAFMINCGVTADVFQTNSTADSFMVWAAGGIRLKGSAVTTETNGIVLPANINVPAGISSAGAQIASDGTNLLIVFQNGGGVKTTNKVSVTAWP